MREIHRYFVNFFKVSGRSIKEIYIYILIVYMIVKEIQIAFLENKSIEHTSCVEWSRLQESQIIAET